MKLRTACLLPLLIAILAARLRASDIESIGPCGGNFQCIEISKSNPEILYAGTYLGGIYKSVDNAKTWQYLGFRGEKVISSIAIDCSDSEHVYFSWRTSGGIASGVMKSSDGGVTWEEVLAPARVVGTSSKIPGLVFVGNNDGVYKSTDGDLSFTKIDYQFGFNNISVITSDPVDSTIVYIGTDNAVYKSTNSGEDWLKLRDAYDFSTYSAHVNEIAVSGLNNDIVLVATSGRGLLVSSDGGASWQEKDFGSQVHGAFCDDTEENVIYATHLSGFLVSEDLGASFQELREGRFKGAKSGGGNFYLIEEEEGAILKSPDRGQTWTNANDGVSNIDVNSLLINGENSELLSLVTAGLDVRLLQYTNGIWDTIKSENLGSRLFKNRSSDSIYMIGGWDVFSRSENQGQTWENYDNGLPYCTPADLAIDNDVLYLACITAFEGLDAGIYKSIDEGDTWFLSSEGLPQVMRQHLGLSKIGPVDMYSLGIDGNNPEHLYAGSYQDLFQSNDSGEKWSRISTFETSYILQILVNPTVPRYIYVIAGNSNNGVANSLYVSANGGKVFSKINCGLQEVHCLLFDNDEGALYAGGKSGVVRSFDRGATWGDVARGWDNAVVTTLIQKVGSHEIFAGTKGNGVYKLSITPTDIAGNNTHNLPGDFVLRQNYPNPFNPATRISYVLPEADVVTLKIFNLKGQELATLVDTFQAAGEHAVDWQPWGFTSGIYFYRLRTGMFSETKKLILQR